MRALTAARSSPPRCGSGGVAGLSAGQQYPRSRYGLIPPEGGGIYGPPNKLTYAAQRLLTRSLHGRLSFRAA